MKTVKIADITLRQIMSDKKSTISFKNKIELAKLLDKLRIDIIETGMVDGGKTDELLVRTIALTVKHSILSCPTGLTAEDVEKAYECIKDARKPRLNVRIPVSPVQMEYLCHKKPQAVVELISTLVKKAKELCADVEFTAVDATRCEKEFLFKTIETAIEAGAGTITVCDTAGTMFADEFASFISEIYDAVPALKNVSLSIEANNSISMASACAFAGVKVGADQIKTTVNGNEFPSVESIVNILKSRGDSCDIHTNVKTTEFRRVLAMIESAISDANASSSPFDTATEDSHSGMALSEGDDIATVSKAVRELGYDLTENDNVSVYEAFCRVAKKKKAVSAKELDAIVATTALQVPPTYKLDSYVINSGNIITATANIMMKKNGKEITGVSAGSGPIDAAFMAIEQIVGCHYELDDFQIQSVTEGKEAMGSALVKLRSNGKVYAGKGVSTDIISASIRAYVSALNKIVYEEG
ncbi:MAG: hypothetical protein E7536_01225 [Ruminococcaceae bacterium]|nr:hypothetical protein [Oscillospiraceae bacterium]